MLCADWRLGIALRTNITTPSMQIDRDYGEIQFNIDHRYIYNQLN